MVICNMHNTCNKFQHYDHAFAEIDSKGCEGSYLRGSHSLWQESCLGELYTVQVHEEFIICSCGYSVCFLLNSVHFTFRLSSQTNTTTGWPEVGVLYLLEYEQTSFSLMTKLIQGHMQTIF
jgi:hypothetical protein